MQDASLRRCRFSEDLIDSRHGGLYAPRCDEHQTESLSGGAPRGWGAQGPAPLPIKPEGLGRGHIERPGDFSTQDILESKVTLPLSLVFSFHTPNPPRFQQASRSTHFRSEM
ncbi:hypothetical protein AAFF_G00208690 [Aldrovandia affinis]|uniref:Uncharacterized protein n=1 Tax=Aldrovandia affinis TaxID=143900 RepID=A0AAD7RH44_9TELE|nr:hypothetical protein AAFF_G00208690 [Aldrovandia affinis]